MDWLVESLRFWHCCLFTVQLQEEVAAEEEEEEEETPPKTGPKFNIPQALR